MRIILDLDGTIILKGDLHPQFSRFCQWVQCEGHFVLVWSSHEDGLAIARLMGFEFISKDDLVSPEGDVLIDDQAEQFAKLCCVNKTYSSLDAFLAVVDKKDA